MKRGKQILSIQYAIFMIFLVLTIPFISSQAYALSITKVTVAGSQGIENVMKSENDYFTATIQTSEEVDSDQVQISYTKDEAFDECSGTTCTYTSARTDRSGQEMDYTIQLINQSIIVDEVEGTILIDEEQPVFEDYDIEKTGEEIIINYEVEDTACEDCTGCSGIDYISVLVDETETQQINIPSDCSVDDTLETTISELNLANGDHELCMIAYDNVGFASDESCEAISIDTDEPSFETNSLSVYDYNGNAVQYVGTDAIVATVKINVTDINLDSSTVRADLSGLNSIMGSSYENMTGVCEQNYEDETLYICTWSNIYIEQVTGAITLTFFASDIEGNEKIYSPAYTLISDNTAPLLVQAYNELGGDNIYLKEGTNSVYADFDPTGSAMDLGRAYLTFSLAGLNRMSATSCWENGAYWSCVWNFSLSYAGSSSSTAYIDAEDDAGNSLEQQDVDFEVDSQEPVITSMTQSLDCPTGSDTMIIEINATDNSEELFATVYGEDVRTSDDPITEECSMIVEGMFTCLITVNDFVSYPENEDVKIEISDLAGNIAEDELDVSVCELEQSGTPSLVTMFVSDVSPIDKLTLSYIDYPLYIPISFSMVSGAYIVSKTATCEQGSMYFIDQSETSSLAVLTIPKQITANGTYSLPVSCSVSLTMQYGNNVYMNPETENITIAVELYGTPLGSIEDSIAQKIEWEKMGIAEKQKKIDRWVTWNRILGTFCTIADVFTKINAAISLVRGVLTVVAAAANKNIFTQPFYQTIALWNTFSDRFNAFIITFVWPPGSFGGIVGLSKLGSQAVTKSTATAASSNNINTIVKEVTDAGFDWASLVGTIVKTGCTLYTGTLCEGYGGIENQIAIKANEYGTPGYYEQYVNGQMITQQQHAEQGYFILTDWDPYKSIHTARSCAYPSAIIYNLRKERQINCMYTKCLEENAKNGLPIDICDIQYKERECLYVDGAAWRVLDPSWLGHFLQLVGNTALSNLDVFGESVLYYAGCLKYSTTIKIVPDFYSLFYMYSPTVGVGNGNMYSNTVCHVGGNLLSLQETNWFTAELDLDFKAELEGTDYCVGYE